MQVWLGEKLLFAGEKKFNHVVSKCVDGFRSQFTIQGFRTRSFWPFSSLKKTKAIKKPVQGMKFSIHPQHRSSGHRRSHNTDLDWVIESLMLSILYCILWIYKFKVQIDPTCTNIGFSISALSRGGRIWRKGTTKFLCSHLAVDILWNRADNCAGNHKCQHKVWFHTVGQEKRAVHSLVGRKQESLFE